jgi:hypothetical protein
VDGLVDGQITNPRACAFDIDTIGPSGDNSLTAWAGCRQGDGGGTRSESGVQRYPGKLGSSGLDSAVRRQRRVRPFHRALRPLAQHDGIRLAGS